MWTLLKKEYVAFFSSLIGLGLLSIFLLTIGFYSWFFEGNIFEYGFAELSVFFEISPWFFMFFIPALCMKLYAEEFEQKTFGLLNSLPITSNQIVLGKTLGAFFVIITCLLPTLLYVFSIGKLGNPTNNFDVSLLFGAYLSILCISVVFIFLSSFASVLSNKQPLAFILGVSFNFAFFQITEELKGFTYLNWELFSLKYHFLNLSKGLIDFSDIIFFTGFSLIFYSLILFRLKTKN
jgi:ABC-2 type transport system permease protein